eukprot:14798863-Heterocapsa_arctica.AAC.1
MARGLGQPHDAAAPDRPDADPIVSTDYGFVGGHDADALEGTHVLPVAKGRRTGTFSATGV